MNITSAKARSFLATFVLLGLCAAVLQMTYAGQIAAENKDIGMRSWVMSGVDWVALFCGLSIITVSIQSGCRRPSDFFRFFYGVVVLMTYLVLHCAAGWLPYQTMWMGFALLFFPLFVLEVAGRIIPRIEIAGVLSHKWMPWIVIGILTVVLMAAAAHSPVHAGFGIHDSLVRRLEGRVTYPARTWLAYGLAMGMNGFAPYLAFVGGLRARVHLVALALLAAFFFYWLLAVKAPFLYVVVAFLVGWLLGRGKVIAVPRYFLLSVIGLGLIVVLEWMFFQHYSLVADYFFRRVFAAPALLQGYYLQFLTGEKTIPWSWLSGATQADFAVTYFVGEHFLGNPLSNANTNAFLLQFAAKGAAGYLLAATVVPVVLTVFDRLYASSGNANYMFLGFLYGLLVVEQAYSVAFVSSGVGALLALTLLERYPHMGQSPALTSTRGG